MTEPEVKSEEKLVRCAICGKLIHSGETVAQVNIGKLQELRVVSAKGWGVVHRDCFNRAMPSPKAALEEIQRLAKSA